MTHNAWAQRGADLRESDGLPAADGAAAGAGAATEPPAGRRTFALAVKCSVAVRGYALTSGCPVFADAIAPADATIVATLRRRGGRVVGTTNCHELAFGITGANAWTGPVTHPADPDRSPGGSSSGSAVVVATGEADLAIGTDTGGSVSIPSSVCGVVGFRPTVGRYPGDGLVGMSWTRDTAGLFARNVATVATADAWLTGRDAADRTPYGAPGRETGWAGGRRLGVPVEFLDGLDPRTERAWHRAAAAASVEWELVEFSLAEVLGLLHRPGWETVGYESRILFSEYAARVLDRTPDEAWRVLLDGVVTPDVADALRRSDARPVRPEAYAVTIERVLAARSAYAAALDAAGCDLVLFPTTPRPATRLVDTETVEHLGEAQHVFSLMTRHTAPGTMLRTPMLTLPTAVDPGELPVGVTVQGRPLADRAVLAAGRELATALAGPGRVG